MKLLSPLEMVGIGGILCLCPQWLVRKHSPGLLEQPETPGSETPGWFPRPAPPEPATLCIYSALHLVSQNRYTGTSGVSLLSVVSKSASLELVKKKEPWP